MAIETATSTTAHAPTRILLFRHGQTAMNVENRFRGLLDVPLSEIGRREAQEAADSLVGSAVEHVYSSPLQRAVEVAEALAAAVGAERVTLLDDLVNLDYGRWEGLTREECAATDPVPWFIYAHDPERAACPEGESLAAAADRVLQALRTVARAHPGETVAAVSHGVMLRLAVLRVEGPVPYDWQFALPTGSAVTFDVDGRSIRLASPIEGRVPKGQQLAPSAKSGR